MCGGRVGKDGIHGVTAASEELTENTPAGHVQIGDPYTQKKMQDFLLEARDEDIIKFITDNGGGGLSSSVGETARFSNGCEVELEKVPLKYEGMDQWEIWISESQERMTLAIEDKEDFKKFIEQQIRYNESLEKVYNNKTQLVKQEKEKLTYEKTEPEYIPFQVYCYEVASVALIGAASLVLMLFKLPIVDNTQLYIYAVIVVVDAIIILCALFIPLLILPRTSSENLLRWIKKHVFRRN